MKSPLELRITICDHILSLGDPCDFDQTQKGIFAALFEAGDQGLTMPQLLEKFRRHKVDRDVEIQRLKAAISKLRHSLLSFFRVDGKIYTEQCSLPELRRGRHAPIPYRLIWKDFLPLTESHRPEVVVISNGMPQELADLAILKLRKDFAYSALQNSEVLKSAFKQVFDGVDFLVEASGERPTEARLRRDTDLIQIPKLTSTPAIACDDIAISCQALIDYAADHPLMVNCECIEVAALAALLSCREKYGLNIDIFEEDQSGRQVVSRLCIDDSADFAVAANAPFFLLGAEKALDYCLIIPLHAEDQILLQKKGERHQGIPNVLVYSDSSAKEQFLNMINKRRQQPIWGSREPWTDEIVSDLVRGEMIWVESLEELIQFTMRLHAGDFVIAWQPLSDGLQRRNKDLVAVTEPFQHWVSLFAHKKWYEGSLDALRQDFLRMFIYEWRICNRFTNDWAWPLVLNDRDFVYFFGGGAGHS